MNNDNGSKLEKGSSHSLDSSTGVPSLPLESHPPPDAPEGGREAYLSLLGGSLGVFISFGWVNCIALFQAYYQSNQLSNYSSSGVSWITSTEFFLMLSVSPLSGFLFDSYGPRLPIFLGGILHVFGLMMASLSSDYYQFMLSQSVCSGIGTSLIFTPAMTAPMTYFKKRRALAGGLAVAGSALGGVVFPIMVNNLLPKVHFGWTMRICAFLILALWAISLAAISSNMNHTRKDFKIANYLRPFTEPSFLILLGFCFFLYWGLFVPFDYLVVSAEHDGMSRTMAFNLIPIMNGASFVGRTIPNAFADKFGRFNVLIIMVILTGVITLGLWYPGHSNAAIIVYAAVFGVSSGACIGLTPPLVMNITKDPREVGFRIGSALAIAGVGTLTSPPIAGAIAGISGGSFANAAIFSGVNFLVAALFLTWLRGKITGWDPRANA